MNASQLQTALAIARSDAALNVEDLSIFEGYALPGFKPVTCTIEALAMLIRWQCVCLDGSIDATELNELAHIARHRFTVLESERGAA